MVARRGASWRALVLGLVLSMVMQTVPVAATDTDVAIGNCSGTPEGGAGYESAKACDGVNSGAWIPPGSGLYQAGCPCVLTVDLGATPPTVHDIQMQTQHYNDWSIQGSTDNATWSVLMTNTGINGTCGDGSGGWGASCYTGSLTYRYYRVVGHGDASNGFYLNEFVLMGGGFSTGAIESYVYNLRAQHPPFQRSYTWQWRGGWSGSYTVKNAGGSTLLSDTYPTSRGAPYTNDFHPGFVVTCSPICGTDTYTIAVHDTLNSVDASYAINGNADGQLIADLVAPHVTRAVACYQVTTSQCGNLGGEWSWGLSYTTAGYTLVNYTFTGAAGINYFVKVGQGSSTLAAPAMASVAVSGTHTPGSYTLLLPIASVSSTGSPSAVLTVSTDASGGLTSVSVMALTFGSGGASDPVVNVPIVPRETCASLDVACGIRQLFTVAGDALTFAVSDSVYGLRATMLTRQPFNFMVRAYEGVTAQIVRAQGSTATSSTCAGITVTYAMPTLPPPSSYGGYGAIATVPPVYGSASPVPFTILRCADLEPWGGSDWWQAIRAAMGPALYLGYAYGWVRKLQPRPVVSG